MAYDENIADRIRKALVTQPSTEEKKMFQGLCFLVNDKMCICIRGHEILCRIGVINAKKELEKDNCRQMVNKGRVMKDFVFVDDTLVQSAQGLNYWLNLCLQFNGEAKASKKRSG